jgi:hypothetical protein
MKPPKPKPRPRKSKRIDPYAERTPQEKANIRGWQKEIDKSLTSPLLYLEWIDAGVLDTKGWLDRKELAEESRPEKFINKTVGWLLRETKDDLVICAQIATARHDDDELFDLAMFIPKSLIRVRRCLKV